MNIKRHILEFLVDHETRLNQRVTRSEICAAFANLSDSVGLHLEQLEREGLLDAGNDGDDTLSLANAFPMIKRLELRGSLGSEVSSGDCTTARNTVGLDLRGVGIAMEGDLFAHVVGDDSMIDAGIKSGDFAILKILPPSRGDVVAVEGSGSLMIRRYVHIAGIPHLLAENPSRPELVAAFDQNIQGVLWCLICMEPSSRGRTASPIKKVCYQNEKELALASEFVTLLKPRIKKGPDSRRGQSTRISSPDVPAVAKRNTTALSQKPGTPKWPKPPTGVELNDKIARQYGTKQSSAVLEETPEKLYGQAYDETLCRDMAELERLKRLVEP